MCNDIQPAFDLDGFLPYRLATVAARVSQALAEEYRARFGISIPEWRVLAHLHAAEDAPVSIRDLQARVGVEKSTLSRAAARLVAAGYVAKTAQAGDRRLVSLVLTASGNTLLAELIPLARGYQARLEAELGSDLPALQAGLAALERATR